MEKSRVARPEAKFNFEKSPMKEAYVLLGATTPLELSNLYSDQDQKLMDAHTWDYKNSDLITNKVKSILEEVDEASLTEDEKHWRDEVLWFWYHHAISCAIWRYKDQAAAQKSSARALEYQSADHPNQLTQLFYFLTRDQIREAENWATNIIEEPEKTSAAKLINDFRSGRFYAEEGP